MAEKNDINESQREMMIGRGCRFKPRKKRFSKLTAGAVALVVESSDRRAASAVLALVRAAGEVLALAVLTGVALVAHAPKKELTLIKG